MGNIKAKYVRPAPPSDGMKEHYPVGFDIPKGDTAMPRKMHKQLARELTYKREVEKMTNAELAEAILQVPVRMVVLQVAAERLRKANGHGTNADTYPTNDMRVKAFDEFCGNYCNAGECRKCPLWVNEHDKMDMIQCFLRWLDYPTNPKGKERQL